MRVAHLLQKVVKVIKKSQNINIFFFMQRMLFCDRVIISATRSTMQPQIIGSTEKFFITVKIKLSL